MARAGKDKQPRKHAGRARKEEIVNELAQKIEASNGLVFADYQGLTTKQTEDLKKQLKASQASMAVTKNTLLKISLSKSQKYADLVKDEPMDKPTATLFLGEDTITPLKAIAKAFKDFSLPKIKFGIIDGQALTEEQVLKLASLPNRETLIAQLVGTLNSPIQGLVVTLNSTLQKFVMTLEMIAKSKPADQPAPQAQVSEQTLTPEQTAETPVQAAETEATPAEEKTAEQATPNSESEAQTQDNQGGDN